MRFFKFIREKAETDSAALPPFGLPLHFRVSRPDFLSCRSLRPLRPTDQLQFACFRWRSRRRRRASVSRKIPNSFFSPGINGGVSFKINVFDFLEARIEANIVAFVPL